MNKVPPTMSLSGGVPRERAARTPRPTPKTRNSTAPPSAIDAVAGKRDQSSDVTLVRSLKETPRQGAGHSIVIAPAWKSRPTKMPFM